MTEIPKLLSLLLNVCSQGCMIVVNDAIINGKNLFISVLPKSMILVDNSSNHEAESFIIRGVDTDHNIYIRTYLSAQVWSDHHGYCCYLAGPGKIKIYDSMCHPKYHLNQTSIDKLVHYSYTKKQETPTSEQLESYRKKIQNIMYKECFDKMDTLCLSMCDQYLISDIKKIIIINLFGLILIETKWANLGICPV